SLNGGSAFPTTASMNSDSFLRRCDELPPRSSGRASPANGRAQAGRGPTGSLCQPSRRRATRSERGGGGGYLARRSSSTPRACDDQNARQSGRGAVCCAPFDEVGGRCRSEGGLECDAAHSSPGLEEVDGVVIDPRSSHVERGAE